MSAQDPSAGKLWTARRPVVVGMLALLILVGGVGSWAFLSRIAGAVIAHGTIVVERNRQVVQHPDGGVVAEIFVSDGDLVKEGDVLLRLDGTRLNSEITILSDQVFETTARIARLEAERDDLPDITFPPELLKGDLADKHADVIDGQIKLFAARKRSVEEQVAQLAQQSIQIEAQVQGIDAQIQATSEQRKFLGAELKAQEELLAQGLTQTARVLGLQREEASLAGQLGELQATRGQAMERIAEIGIAKSQLLSQRREEAITQLRDIDVNRREAQNNLTEALARQARLEIRAPVGGLVYGMSIFAPQSVLRPADPLLFIIPQDRPLLISAEIMPTNVDQVWPGQEVTLRFTAFDARSTPELMAEVVKVSADALMNERTGQAFYQVEIRLRPGEIQRLPEGLHLQPGLPVEAFIKTGEHSPIAYLIKPFTDYFAKAFRDQ